eukprot:7391555-Prymnesium_polylepis.5
MGERADGCKEIHCVRGRVGRFASDESDELRFRKAEIIVHELVEFDRAPPWRVIDIVTAARGTPQPKVRSGPISKVELTDRLTEHVRLKVDAMECPVASEIVHDVAHAAVEQEIRVLRGRVHNVNLTVCRQLGQLSISLVVCDDDADRRHILDVLDDPGHELVRHAHSLLVKLIGRDPVVGGHSLVCLLKRCHSGTRAPGMRAAFERPAATVEDEHDRQAGREQLL